MYFDTCFIFNAFFPCSVSRLCSVVVSLGNLCWTILLTLSRRWFRVNANGGHLSSIPPKGGRVGSRFLRELFFRLLCSHGWLILYGTSAWSGQIRQFGWLWDFQRHVVLVGLLRVFLCLRFLLPFNWWFESFLLHNVLHQGWLPGHWGGVRTFQTAPWEPWTLMSLQALQVC